MLLFSCQNCGSNIITFDMKTDSVCPNCGEVASAEHGLRISIPLGIEMNEEMGFEAPTPREDLVWLG